jgi:uncharacterized membrane protein
MIRRLLFMPMFGPADMLITTAAGALALSGHVLASLPVFALGAGLYAWARRKGWNRPMRMHFGKGR